MLLIGGMTPLNKKSVAKLHQCGSHGDLKSWLTDPRQVPPSHLCNSKEHHRLKARWASEVVLDLGFPSASPGVLATIVAWVPVSGVLTYFFWTAVWRRNWRERPHFQHAA